MHDTVVCGSVHMVSLVAHMFVEPRKETCLYFIKYFFQSQHCFETLKIFICAVEKCSNQKRIIIYGRKLPFSESVFTFKIFLILKILPIHNWSKNALRSSDTVRGVLENCVIKIVNFCRTEAGLTSKWGRILLSVYWWYQNQPSYTVGRRATSRDVAKCFWKIGWLHTHTQTHNTTYWGSTLPKNHNTVAVGGQNFWDRQTDTQLHRYTDTHTEVHIEVVPT